MKKISSGEKQLLSLFFSNLTRPVFVLKNLPEVVKGALFSRYSRSSRGLRPLFLLEYLKNEELELNLKELGKLKETQAIERFLNTKRAHDFYRKWLAEYGDDSIAELGGVHLATERVSVLAAKTIEEQRLGLSFLEKSTRYVRFDNKVAGRYRYFRPPEIQKSRHAAAYLSALDGLFSTYARLIPPLTAHLQRKFIRNEGVSEKAYARSLRAKACDTLRGLLPLASLTNVGIYGNGRAFEYLLTKMGASLLPELVGLKRLFYRELEPFIGSFISRVESEKGKAYRAYLRQNEEETRKMTLELLSPALGETSGEKPGVTLLDYDPAGEKKVAAAVLYPFCRLSFEKLLALVSRFSRNQIQEILGNYLKDRAGRWHKVGRAFEETAYTFEITSDFGVYKDLSRHRLVSRLNQSFTPQHGFVVPAELYEIKLEGLYQKALNRVGRAFFRLQKDFPQECQYLVCHAHLLRWKIKLNLREAFHLCELRSSPQGHPHYRRVAQAIALQIKKVHPLLGELMRFVNFAEPGLERLATEVRREEKLAALAERLQIRHRIKYEARQNKT